MWRTVTVILGWLAVTLSAEQAPTDPGHFFIPCGKLYPSYSSWAISVSTNMAPYRKQTKILAGARTTLGKIVRDVTSQRLNVTADTEPAIKLLGNQLKSALDQLNAEADGLMRTFQDVLYPPNIDSPKNSPAQRSMPTRRFLEPLRLRHTKNDRTKRALDFIGDIGHALFGIATESEIKHLNRNLKLLNEKDMALAHRFNGTLQVLNSTRVGTTQNRKALQTLTKAVSSMKKATVKLRAAIIKNDSALKLGFLLTDMASEVLRTSQAVQYLFAELGAISHKFALAQVGVLHKNLIPRKEFIRLVRNIRKTLPNNFELPFAAEDTNNYIRIAKTKLIEGTDMNHVLFYIPLLYTRHAFDAFRFFPYQVPLHAHNVSLMYYPSEPRYLLMSENRQHYIQPAQNAIETCILAKQPFCPLHEPAYSSAESTSCVVALFKRDLAATRRYCTPTILPSNDSPKAYYLTKGQWLLVLRPPLSITIFCASTQQSRTELITEAVHTITLAPEYSASGAAFYLPPYYAGETHLELPLFRPHSTDISLPIWRPEWPKSLARAISSNVTHLPELHIDGMHADAYFDRILAQPLEQVTNESPSAFSRSMLLMIIIGMVSLLCFGFLLKHCCPLVVSIIRLRRRSVRPTLPPEPEAPEPAVEMQELSPMVSPRHRCMVEDVNDPQFAEQEETPIRGATPPFTTSAHAVSSLHGVRPATHFQV